MTRRGAIPCRALAWSLALLAGAPLPGASQGFQEMVQACASGDAGLLHRCHQAALALDAARGAHALAAAAGSEVVGSAGTLGYRLPRTPRFSLGARVGAVRASLLPILADYSPASGERTLLLPAVQVQGTLGLFDGFSARPAVGGILALDLTASYHLLFPSRDAGFVECPGGGGGGGRVGILRESFNAPGVSVSVARRSLGEGQLGDMAGDDPAQVRFKGEVTSVRGLVGKDILGLGLLAGVGWDRVEGKGSLGVRVSPRGFAVHTPPQDLTSERVVLFAGGSMTFLILQVSAEGGWSRARTPPLPTTPGGDAFPDHGAYFGSVAYRLTFTRSLSGAGWPARKA